MKVTLCVRADVARIHSKSNPKEDLHALQWLSIKIDVTLYGTGAVGVRELRLGNSK
jgi:hypothetical protein